MIYRCTRNRPYCTPGCPGHKNPSSRQGHYIKAASREEAIAVMAFEYRDEAIWGFTIQEDHSDDIQYWTAEEGFEATGWPRWATFDKDGNLLTPWGKMSTIDVSWDWGEDRNDRTWNKVIGGAPMDKNDQVRFTMVKIAHLHELPGLHAALDRFHTILEEGPASSKEEENVSNL